MRTIARGNTPEKCPARVDQLKKDNWMQISEIMMDPTPTIDPSWVCVLEKQDNGRKEEKRHGWNRNPAGLRY